MGICIEIEVDDQGQATVGVCPPAEEGGEPKDYMQPAGSVQEALQMAAQLLQSGATGADQGSGQVQDTDQGAQEAASQAFGSIRGGA